MQSFRKHCEYIASRKLNHSALQVDLPAIRCQFLDYTSPTEKYEQMIRFYENLRGV